MTEERREDDMQDLIERLEKATGPDRELDMAIAMKVIDGAQKGDGPLLCLDRAPWVINAPKYTASIDAALTLVPEGYWFRLQTDAFNQKPHAWVVHENDLSSANKGESATPAIALCIAALKARSTTPLKAGE